MIHLPSLLKRALAGTMALLLAGSLAQAGLDYSGDLNARLALVGKTIQTASQAQLQSALTGAITENGAAGEYLHAILLERNDRNGLASPLTWTAIQSAGAATNPVLTGSIAGQGSALDLQAIVTNPLTLSTISKVSSSVIKNIASDKTINPDVSVRNELSRQAALSIAATVATNLPIRDQKVTYTTGVVPSLMSNKMVVGSFIAGVSTVGNVADTYTDFTKTMVAKYSSAASQICYSVIALSGSLANDRIQNSAIFGAGVSFDSSASVRGLIAQGVVKAVGTANTASVIDAILNAGRGKTGKEILVKNLPAFSGAVAGAVTTTGSDQAALMRSITTALASGTYSIAIGETAMALTDAEKAQLGAAAVKVAPYNINNGDHNKPDFNPANAAVVGILSTGIQPANLYSFAITVAKGAKSYENVAQVGNALANQLTPSAPLDVNGITPPPDYVAVSGSMIKAFPKAAAEISRRVAQLIPANDVILPNQSGTNQAARINFAKALVTSFPGSAAAIAMGIVKTDPNCADNVAAEIVKMNTKAAVAIVTNVSNSVPAEEASEIAVKMGELIGNKTLALSQAGSITNAIAGGALVKLSGDELPVIAAQLIGQIMQRLYVPGAINAADVAMNNSLVNTVGTIAQNVAKIAFKTNSTNPGDTDWNSLTRFADQIAGAAVGLLTTLLPQNDRDRYINAISTKIQSVVPSLNGKGLVRQAVDTAKSNPNSFVFNALMEVETPVTNF